MIELSYGEAELVQVRIESVVESSVVFEAQACLGLLLDVGAGLLEALPYVIVCVFDDFRVCQDLLDFERIASLVRLSRTKVHQLPLDGLFQFIRNNSLNIFLCEGSKVRVDVTHERFLKIVDYIVYFSLDSFILVGDRHVALGGKGVAT